MIIGVDLDGVVADWNAGVCEEFGVDPSATTDWDSIFTLTNTTPAELFAHCRRNNTFANLEPIPQAKECIALLHDEGHDIQFVTHRPAWSSAATEAWLYNNFDLPDLLWRVHMVNGPADKASVPCDVYLDDSPHVIKALRKARRFVVRYEQPWNRKAKASASVSSWLSFVTLVKGMK